MASFFCLIVASIDYGKSRVLTFELPNVNKPTCAQPQANTSIIYWDEGRLAAALLSCSVSFPQDLWDSSELKKEGQCCPSNEWMSDDEPHCN